MKKLAFYILTILSFVSFRSDNCYHNKIPLEVFCTNIHRYIYKDVYEPVNDIIVLLPYDVKFIERTEIHPIYSNIILENEDELIDFLKRQKNKKKYHNVVQIKIDSLDANYVCLSSTQYAVKKANYNKNIKVRTSSYKTSYRLFYNSERECWSVQKYSH